MRLERRDRCLGELSGMGVVAAEELSFLVNRMDVYGLNLPEVEEIIHCFLVCETCKQGHDWTTGHGVGVGASVGTTLRQGVLIEDRVVAGHYLGKRLG